MEAINYHRFVLQKDVMVFCLTGSFFRLPPVLGDLRGVYINFASERLSLATSFHSPHICLQKLWMLSNGAASRYRIETNEVSSKRSDCVDLRGGGSVVVFKAN